MFVPTPSLWPGLHTNWTHVSYSIASLRWMWEYAERNDFMRDHQDGIGRFHDNDKR